MSERLYELAIHADAEREWAKLDATVKARFKAKLGKERLRTPRVPRDALHGLLDCYKSKITTSQFRLAYNFDDSRRLVTLLAVSSRDDVYSLLEQRLR